ncbi:MAG: slipin family protein [Spirochaetales bacterium]|nr:slipin family protein [Spirochaetales bacterium]
MNLFQNKINRIKNLKTIKPAKDFHYSALSFVVLGIFIGVGYVLQMYLIPGAEAESLVRMATGILVGGAFIASAPMWVTVIIMIIIMWISMVAFLDISYYLMALSGSIGLILSSSIQMIYQWDKVVILRMGKFKRVHGPGIHFLLPLIDRIAAFVDTRIRATDFSAEKTLTKDTVPVHVDALAFWMIWDPKQAVLEVEDYLEAVTLSAQTALRDSIGKHELSSLLSERDELGKEIQKALDAKTNPWGVTILSIEITDIIIPKELEDSMSKQAQAERERQSRVILGMAEVEIAEKFEQAAEKYKDNPVALQLRAMNMVYEGIRQNKSSLMLLPSSALDNMNLGSVMGTAALNKVENRFDENKTHDSNEVTDKENSLEGGKDD